MTKSKSNLNIYFVPNAKDFFANWGKILVSKIENINLSTFYIPSKGEVVIFPIDSEIAPYINIDGCYITGEYKVIDISSEYSKRKNSLIVTINLLISEIDSE